MSGRKKNEWKRKIWVEGKEYIGGGKKLCAEEKYIGGGIKYGRKENNNRGGNKV